MDSGITQGQVTVWMSALDRTTQVWRSRSLVPRAARFSSQVLALADITQTSSKAIWQVFRTTNATGLHAEAGCKFCNLNDKGVINMTYKTNLYPSTGCNAEYVEMMAREAAANDYKEIVLEKCGYTLIGTHLVPETFLEHVKAELENNMFDYGCVLSETYIFDAEFLASLDQDSRAVLMPVVLVLIERGDFPLNFFESEEEAA